MRPFWHTGIFWAFALGLFLNAYVYGIAAVALAQLSLHGSPTVWGLAWAPAGFLVGIITGGWSADRMGRRAVLTWAPLGYVLGSLGLLLGRGIGTVLMSSLLLLATAGLESNTILTYSQELLPTATRRQAMYAELNFVNLGGLALASVALASHRWGPAIFHHLLSWLPVGLALLSWPIRTRIPESRLWRERRRRPYALPRDYKLRFVVAAVFSFSNTAGFSLMAFAFGHEFLPRHFHHLLLVSTLSAFLVGLLARWVGRWPPKFLLLLGYGMASVSAVSLLFIRAPHRVEFWAVLLVLSACTSLSYLAEDTFKSDLWPSAVRARIVAAVRAIGMSGYMGLLLWEYCAGLSHFVRVMAGTWTLGFAAAAVWWFANRLPLQHHRAVPERRLANRTRHNKLR